jgi:peptide/nickel transport system permease protein
VTLARNRSALNWPALAGGFIVASICAAAILAPVIAPFDPLKTDFLAVRQPPSGLHWFGADELGRDILSRVIWGGRASMLAGLLSVAMALILGVPLGLAAGYCGGWTDAAISRVLEAMLSCPFLILAIALSVFLGPNLINAMIAIGISAAPVFARLTRGQVMAVLAEDYILAAHALGLSDRRIILRHVLPNIGSTIVVQATLTAASAIIAEASLSYLGLGQQAPQPSWGSMLNVAKSFIEEAPWMSIPPGAAIFLTVVGLNLLGDGLRDALDPKQS